VVPNPPAGPPPLPATSAPVLATSVVGAAVIQAGHSLDAELRTRIDAALAECADAARSEVMLKHFGRSPTREECKEVVGTEVVETLLRQGRSAELRGTIEPDIVIHEGQPHRVQDIYDYKFPCAPSSKRSDWRTYPEGNPHAGKSQGEVYQKALGGEPARVQPHLGVYR
jgi:hypothetical protein